MKVGNDTVDDAKLTSYSIAGIDTSKSFDQQIILQGFPNNAIA